MNKKAHYIVAPERKKQDSESQDQFSNTMKSLENLSLNKKIPKKERRGRRCRKKTVSDISGMFNSLDKPMTSSENAENSYKEILKIKGGRGNLSSDSLYLPKKISSNCSEHRFRFSTTDPLKSSDISLPSLN